MYKYFFSTLAFSYSLCSIIILPFKSTKNIQKKDNESFLTIFTPQNYITQISIGTPTQEINIHLTLRDYRFYIANDICYNDSISYYNYSNSSSFNSIYSAESPFDDLADASLASDKVSFYNDINFNNNLTIEKFKFYFYQTYKFKENTKIFCGVIGLSINREDYNLNYYDDSYYLERRPLRRRGVGLRNAGGAGPRGRRLPGIAFSPLKWYNSHCEKDLAQVEVQTGPA